MRGKIVALSVVAAVMSSPAAALLETVAWSPPGGARALPYRAATPDAHRVAMGSRAQRTPPALDVDYQRSTLVAKLRKAGLLRFLGHEHGVVPGAWSADVRFDPQDLERSSLVVEIPVSELIIDTDRARRLAGVDPEGPSEQDVEEIRAKMVSAEQLDADSFSTIRFESSALHLRPPSELRIEGTLTLHGVRREIAVEAALESNASGFVVRGSFAIGQRDFGIEPVSIGGVVKVADEVEISFEIFAAEALTRSRGSQDWTRKRPPRLPR